MALPVALRTEDAEMTDRPGSPEDFLPLSPPAFNILLALGRGRLHPYGMMQAIDQRTGGKAVILPGTLYTSIARMLKQGLLEDAPEGAQANDGDERRRYYRLTPLGCRVAEAEAERMTVLLQFAHEQRLAPANAARSVEPAS
jgi:DNA-binding PadR family transcriptional regulator